MIQLMEDKMDLKEYLITQDYFDLKEIPGQGMCGLLRMLFTVGLVVGIEEHGYRGRYCYDSLAEAKSALNEWDGTGDPNYNWIKWKGEGGDRCRIFEDE
jgi:hypothetical protein